MNPGDTGRVRPQKLPGKHVTIDLQVAVCGRRWPCHAPASRVLLCAFVLARPSEWSVLASVCVRGAPCDLCLGYDCILLTLIGVRCLSCVRDVFPMHGACGSALCEDHSCYLVGIWRNKCLLSFSMTRIARVVGMCIAFMARFLRSCAHSLGLVFA